MSFGGNTIQVNELLVKLMLIYLRDHNELLTYNLFKINSIGFKRDYGFCEYNSLPRDVDMMNFRYGVEGIKHIAYQIGIFEVDNNGKSDVYINNEGYVIKTIKNSRSTLINQISRPAFEKICNFINVPISILDSIIEEYWYLREHEIISENVKNSNPKSPFAKNKELLRPILNYFLFTGTGMGSSKYPAKYILDYDNPLDTSTWRVFDSTNIIDEIWDGLVFGIREKKRSPKGYINNNNNNNNENISIWTRYSENQYKGSLHIRIS